MKRNLEIEEWLFAFFAFGLSAPYFLWNLPVNGILFVLSIVLVYKNWDSRLKLFLPLFALMYLWVALRSNFTFIGIITVALFWPIFNARTDFMSNSFKKYKILFSITVIPSIIVYLFFLAGFDLSYHTIEPANSLKEGYYRAYPFMVLYESMPGFPMLRFHGYYDEPGIVGTVSGILLLTDNINLKNKYNIPILISGILSLSMFFYILIIIYIILFAKIGYKIIMGLGMVLALVFIFSIGELDLPFLQRFIIEDGKFAGDSRTSSAYDLWFSNYITSFDSLIGYGGNKAGDLNVGGSSYKDLIVNYGLIFFVIYLLSFFLYILHHCKKKISIYVCLFVLICTFYQRPAIFDFFYLFLWCGIICVMSQEELGEYNYKVC